MQDLCDVEPEKIHITVPAGYRIRRRGGGGDVVHHEDRQPRDLGWFEGVRIVTAEKAIRQAIVTAVVPHLVAQAIDTARGRGRITEVVAGELDVLLRRADD